VCLRTVLCEILAASEYGGALPLLPLVATGYRVQLRNIEYNLGISSINQEYRVQKGKDIRSVGKTASSGPCLSTTASHIHETKLQTKSEEHFRAVSKYLEEARKSYLTYQIKSSKGLQVVLKGIEPDVTAKEVFDALKEKGFSAKNISLTEKQEKKLAPASRSLYTLAVILIKFKNTKNGIPNSVYVRKHRSYNLFQIIFPPIFRSFLWQIYDIVVRF